MRKILPALAALLLAAFCVSCYNTHRESTRPRVQAMLAKPRSGQWLTGAVAWYDGSGVFGEKMPAGLILVGTHGYPRLYLRRDGELNAPSIANYKGRLVRVRGILGYVTGGTDVKPFRAYRVLDVAEITFAQDRWAPANPGE